MKVNDRRSAPTEGEKWLRQGDCGRSGFLSSRGVSAGEMANETVHRMEPKNLGANMYQLEDLHPSFQRGYSELTIFANLMFVDTDMQGEMKCMNCPTITKPRRGKLSVYSRRTQIGLRWRMSLCMQVTKMMTIF